MKNSLLPIVLFISVNVFAIDPDSVVTTIKVKNTSQLGAILSWLKSNDVRIVKQIKDNNGTVRGIATMMTQGQRNQFGVQFSSATAFAQVSAKMKAGPFQKSSQPEPGYGDLTLWGLNAIQASVIQRSRPEGDYLQGSKSGTKVCVLDTGIAWDHPALKQQVVDQWNVNIDYCQIQNKTSLCDNYDICDDDSTSDLDENLVAWDEIRSACDYFGLPIPSQDLNQLCFNSDGVKKPCAYDDFDHGTHVAGIIGARNIKEYARTDVQGVDPSAQLIAVKGLGYWWFGPEWGYLYTGFDFTVAEGIWACMALGAQVINMSLGGESFSEIERDAIVEAAGAGIVLVAAAGNDPLVPADWQFPAAFPEVLSVTAVHPDGKLAWWSSRGRKTDFAAPGVSILAPTIDQQGTASAHFITNDWYPNPCQGSYCPKGTYMYDCGTSMAAPHVAGVASLMLSFDPWLDVTFLRWTDIGLPRTEQGVYGLITAKESVEH